MRPQRLAASLDLVDALGLLHGRLREPPAATRDELLRVHAPEFIDAVARLSSGDPQTRRQNAAFALQFGLGSGDTPAFPNMYAVAAGITGASIAAARAVLSGALHHAFAPAGGLHHAQRDRASGFCVFNDVAAAIAAAVTEFDARVLYVDFDAHHGDGVQAAFYTDPRVLTVSFHESGRYLFPGTGDPSERGSGRGVGTAVNMPFAPYTEDGSWLAAVELLLPELCQGFAPDLIVSQHGCDGHTTDPLTHLNLTTGAFAREAGLTHQLAHTYSGGRWLATGGGGYQPLTVVPRGWAGLFSEQCGAGFPSAVPAAWLARWQPLTAASLPATFLDPPVTDETAVRRGEVEAMNRATMQVLRDLL